jgi:hypothetical protein
VPVSAVADGLKLSQLPQPAGASAISGTAHTASFGAAAGTFDSKLAPIGGKLGLNLRSSIRTDRSVAKCRDCKQIDAQVAMSWQERQQTAPASISSHALLPPLDRSDGSSPRSASAASNPHL